MDTLRPRAQAPLTNGQDRTQLHLGCTLARHKQLGIHAVVNARSGLQALNAPDDCAMWRDCQKIRSRVRVHRFETRFCRKHFADLQCTMDD